MRASTVWWAVTAVVFVFVLFLFDPTAARGYPRCVLYSFTGFYCSGCGALRALHFLLHGRICDALRMNALLVVGVPPVVVVWVVRPRWRLTLLPLSGLIAVVVFAILRNVPAWPFVFLAPH